MAIVVCASFLYKFVHVHCSPPLPLPPTPYQPVLTAYHHIFARFRATRCDRQWHDLSFCLSLLSYSEKTLKKLLDNIACYHDKLSDTEVFSNFNLVVDKARKNVKSEDLLNDFETKLRFCHDKAGGDGTAGTDEILSQMKDLIIKPPPPPSTKQTRARGRKKKKSSTEEEEEEEEKEERANRTKRPVRRGKRKPPVSSEESDDDLELPNIQNDTESSAEDSDDFETSVRGSGRTGRKKPPPVAVKGKSKPATSSRRSRR